MHTDIELYQASDISVDASVIDVSEVESDEDKAFLIEAGTEILEIQAKAEYAIKKVVATIQGRANLEMGKTLARVQDRFQEGKTPLSTYKKFFASVNVTYSNANLWANAWRATQEFKDIFDGVVEPEKVLECSDTALGRIMTLPKKFREEQLAEVAVGNSPTRREVEELAKQPEVKLSKAEELLAKARARKLQADDNWEEAKADPNVETNSKEYELAIAAKRNNDKAVAKFEQQIAELRALVEEERLKSAKQNEHNAKLEVELQKMKFDDATVRADRIKRVSNQLLVQVPAVLSEVQKFYAEIEHYDNNTRDFLEEQLDLLTAYLKDHR